VSAGWLAVNARRGAAAPRFLSPLGNKVEPMAKGKFQPTWESLQQYQAPEWYRDAKFGIWATRRFPSPRPTMLPRRRRWFTK
jgi:hypothetical protein